MVCSSVVGAMMLHPRDADMNLILIRNQADKNDVETDHYYLQLNSVGTKRWILDDLTAFRPEKSFFIADPKQNRGANCRFGARGITASNHWDGGRNFVSILRGAKRYILLPPSECSSVYLYVVPQE